MGDLFDEFMEELRRRQADARKGHPSRPSDRGRERSGADDEPPESEAGSDPMLSANDGTREPGADETSADAADADEAGADGPDRGGPGPTPLRGPPPRPGSSRPPGGGPRGPPRPRPEGRGDG